MRICSFQEFAHRLGDVLEDTPAPSLALVGHQLHAVPPLLLRLLGEVGGKPRQGLVVSREVGRHGEIDIGGVELHVDLLVDQSLTILMVVLPDLGHRHPHWRCAAVSRGGGTEALI